MARARFDDDASTRVESPTRRVPDGGENAQVADRMVENCIGTYSLPVGVATNFKIDGAQYVVPFAVEEASVVAAASNAAKRCLARGGFVSEMDAPVMIGQVEIRGCPHPHEVDLG